MFLEILIAITLGVASGIFTGLIPGVHVNLVTVFVLSLTLSLLSSIPVLFLILFIFSLALTHTFIDSIPSIYLGAPDPAHALSVLPGHQLLHEGKGYQAIVYTVIGSFFGLITTLLVVPLITPFLIVFAEIISNYIGWLLLVIIFFLLYFSNAFVKNSLFFLASGILGFLVFALPSQEQVLLPLLSGLFGVSTLLYSLLTTSVLPTQNITLETTLTEDEGIATIGRATLVGIVAGFLPGFGASQGSIVALSTMNDPQPKEYLLLTGAINTVTFMFSLVTFTLLAKARNGAILGIAELYESFVVIDLWLFAAVALFVGGVGVLFALFFAKKLLWVLQQINYEKLVYGVIGFLFLLVLLLSGWQGVVILCAASGLGLLAQFYGAQKNMLLGCLLLTVLGYFL